MRIRIGITVLLVFVLQGARAQVQTKWKFHSFNQVGLLNGESVTAFHLQTVNGFQHNNLFAGIGAGLDYYRYKSIPLFAELRNYFGKTTNRFFVYADGGIHFVWEKNNQLGGNTEKNHPGFYSNMGLGYQAGLKNGMGVLLSAGYSYKNVKDKQAYNICPFIGPCYIQTDTYKYDFNRLIIQIGWMF